MTHAPESFTSAVQSISRRGKVRYRRYQGCSKWSTTLKASFDWSSCATEPLLEECICICSQRSLSFRRSHLSLRCFTSRRGCRTRVNYIRSASSCHRFLAVIISDGENAPRCRYRGPVLVANRQDETERWIMAAVGNTDVPEGLMEDARAVRPAREGEMSC